MNLDSMMAFYSAHTVWVWTTGGMVSYLFIFLLTDLAFTYFGGWEAAERARNVTGLPILAVAAVVRPIYRFFSWPWRLRAMRLWRYYYDFEPGATYSERYDTQKRVDIHLQELARVMHSYFEQERQVRRTGTAEEIANAKNTSAYHKSRFWESHEAARRLGYRTKKRYAEYLINN